MSRTITASGDSLNRFVRTLSPGAPSPGPLFPPAVAVAPLHIHPTPPAPAPPIVVSLATLSATDAAIASAGLPAPILTLPAREALPSGGQAHGAEVDMEPPLPLAARHISEDESSWLDPGDAGPPA
eukprot:scaffold276140_cov31-Tisochrysis_lutea.AAC.4